MLDLERPSDIGHHIAEVFGTDTALLTDRQRLEDTSDRITSQLGLVVVRKSIHEFQPQGHTILKTLASSHEALHTWPELKRPYLHLDIFACGPSSLDRLIPVLVENLDPLVVLSWAVPYPDLNKLLKHSKRNAREQVIRALVPIKTKLWVSDSLTT